MDPRPDLGRRDAVVLKAEGDVVAGARHDQLRLGVLKHEARAAPEHELAFPVPAGRVEQARERLQERALTGAGRS
jgi:hypothetical protein